MSRLKRLAPYFLIGPVSGPLLAGVVHNFQGGRPVLAALYGVALLEYVIFLPTLVPMLAIKLGVNLV